FPGPVEYQPSEPGLDVAGNAKLPLAHTSAIPPLAYQDYGNGTRSQAEILAIAKVYIEHQKTAFFSRMAAYLRRIAADRAFYTFDQEVHPSGAAHALRLVWSVLIDATGNATYGDPSIINANPQTVYIVYTARAVSSELPQEWEYPAAGTLRYQLRKPNGTPLTNWTVIDTQGAYDEPLDDETATDPDAGLKCLADKS